MLETKDMTKDQLKSLALKQRIGEITSDYEDRIADIRADATQRFEAFQNLVKDQEAELDRLREQLRNYQDAESDVQVKEDSSEPTN